MAGERENLSKTLLRSDQDEEMMPTASEDLATVTSTAIASASGDQALCNQPRFYDSHKSHLQCEVKRMKSSASQELQNLFRDFRGRRAGILKGLTTVLEFMSIALKIPLVSGDFGNV